MERSVWLSPFLTCCRILHVYRLILCNVTRQLLIILMVLCGVCAILTFSGSHTQHGLTRAKGAGSGTKKGSAVTLHQAANNKMPVDPASSAGVAAVIMSTAETIKAAVVFRLCCGLWLFSVKRQLPETEELVQEEQDEAVSAFSRWR